MSNLWVTATGVDRFQIRHETSAEGDGDWQHLRMYDTHHPEIEDIDGDMPPGAVATLGYREHPHHVEIGWRSTHGWQEGDDTYLRKGHQERLQDRLHEMYPGKPVYSESGLTQDAYDFRKKYIERHPDAPWHIDHDNTKMGMSLLWVRVAAHDIGPQYHGAWGPIDLDPEYPWMHVGTREAAEDRLEHGRRWRQTDTPHVYRVHLHPDAVVHPHVMSDEDAEDMSFGDLERSGAHVIPYRNDYEDKGSTSYRVHKSVVRGVHEVPVRRSIDPTADDGD